MHVTGVGTLERHMLIVSQWVRMTAPKHAHYIANQSSYGNMFLEKH